MKKTANITIITIIIYFISVVSFLITKAELALTLWEVLTIIGGLIILILLVSLSEKISSNSFYKRIISVFMSCAVTLTSVAHVVNITVTRKLISDGVNVPNYFKIGYWPSVEMAIDYLAWGFFVGLSFICMGISIKNTEHKSIKISSNISGILCLLGFFGTLFVNENLWYLAPIGYGIFPIYLCIKIKNVK